MTTYVVGQRFVSEAEPELGLGLVEGVEGRHIVLRFPASATVRRYASASAPIKRVVYRVGDEVADHAGRRFRIEAVEERGGLVFYRGREFGLAETALSDRLSFSTPIDRLQAGIQDLAQRPAGFTHYGLHVQNAAQAVANFRRSGVTVSDTNTSDTKAILANITDPYMGRIELAELPPESLHYKAIQNWK